ncbi:MAG: outer membrane beta-barrel protein [Phycisphaerae bacterium]|nr:outer membrane beta-barrel protein [Phycisphaerae bacterium]
MTHRRNLKFTMAVAAAMAGAGLILSGPLSVGAAVGTAIPAADTTVSLDSTTAPATPAPAPDTNPLLMYSLDKIPDANGSTLGQDLQTAGINIFGYVEAGYTSDLSGRPAGGVIPTRVFDTEYGNHIQLDQVDLTVARAINFSDPAYMKRGWDVGGKVEWLYGYDPGTSDNIHPNGLNFYHSYATQNSGVTSAIQDPMYQFDLEQAYVTLGLHLGGAGDLKIKAGTFVTLLGEETINPTTNYLYSHSYGFGMAIPFTQTGVLVGYFPNSQWTFWNGVTRGWNQALSDNNTGLDYLGEVSYTPNSQWTLTVNLSVGPQDTGTNNPYRTVVEPLITYVPPILGNKLTLASDTTVGYDGAGNGSNGGSSGWFDEAVYQSYNVNSYLTFNAREEYYYDGAGFTMDAFDFNPPPAGVSVQYGEVTLGMKITPFPNSSLGKNFYVRPEVRLDMADHGVLTNGKHYQTTVGVDAIYTF